MKNFSRRHKLDFVQTKTKYETVPLRFRIDILKLIKDSIRDTSDQTHSEYCIYQRSAISISHYFEPLFTLDEIHEFYSSALFYSLLEKAEWHEILSLIEHLVNEEGYQPEEFNELFQYYNLGYEIIIPDEENCFDARPSLIVTVKYDTVLKSCNELLDSEIKYPGVVAQVEAAKDHLIHPKTIDLAASVKNSIGAVEGFLKGQLQIKKRKSPTLGESIKILRKTESVSTEILNIVEQMYVFRNRTENVGHGSPTYPA
jgi:hypothetical protein